MKKVSLKKLASITLLFVLALDANHLVLASDVIVSSPPKIDMKTLQAKQRLEVAKLRQQGKSDSDILDIITATPSSATIAPPLSRAPSKLVISKLNPEEKTEAAHLRQEGKSDTEILSILKNNENQVQRKNLEPRKE